MLEDLLGSKVRSAIVSALVDAPEGTIHLRELVRRSGGSVSGVQRELERLEGVGIIASRIDDLGRRQVSLVTSHPFADPLVGLVAAEARAAYGAQVGIEAGPPSIARAEMHSTSAELLNPRIRGLADDIVRVALEHGAIRVALFGSSTQPEPSVAPKDLDVTVRFDPNDVRSRAELFFGLARALEVLSGLPVDLVEIDAVENPYLLRELDESEVVLHEAP